MVINVTGVTKTVPLLSEKSGVERLMLSTLLRKCGDWLCVLVAQWVEWIGVGGLDVAVD